ncbi:glycosyltransferase [Cyclobacteriaceae bacterium]|nr:glycosyltransferase [Cyclobacteriaceae bacterium]MDB4315586.1 glycosyltransferase [Cyclobacteriaceae bacterium]MDB4605735.1 glycosyltransferase [Cyclobacteriaceae bacterium]
MRPLISIIIPTYNHGQYIGRALNSVLEQTYQNFEIIVIDNNSIDNTGSILSKYESEQRVRIFKISNHGVIAKSRNKGIEYANGEWIAFLDSDDWWENKKLEYCVNNVNDYIDVIYHDLIIVGDENSKRLKNRTRQVKKDVFRDLILSGNIISNSSVFVRYDLIKSVGGFNETHQIIGAEDWNLLLKISRRTNNFLYLRKFLGFYQIHENGISKKDMSECHEHAMREFWDELNSREKGKVLGNISYMQGRYALKSRDYKLSRHKFYYSLLHGKSEIMLKSLIMLFYLSFNRLKNI